MPNSPDLLRTCDGESLPRGSIVSVFADLTDPALHDGAIVAVQDMHARMHRVLAGHARAFFSVRKRRGPKPVNQAAIEQSYDEWRRAVARTHGWPAR